MIGLKNRRWTLCMTCMTRMTHMTQMTPAIGLMVVALFAVSMLGGCATKPVRLRVLTYNIHHGEGTDGVFDYERLAAVIKAQKPDLVALQEVDNQTGRSSGIDQAKVLGDLTGLKSLYGMAMAYDGGEYGEAILTSLPIVETHNAPLPYSMGHEPRSALMARVRVGQAGQSERHVWFIGTHLDHTRNPADRLAQAKEINRVIGRDDQALAILAGDLNAVPESEVMQTFYEMWTDSAVVAGNPQPTIPSHNPRRRIDYVLYRPANQFRVIESKVIHEPVASDHAPYLTVLELVELVED